MAACDLQRSKIIVCCLFLAFSMPQSSNSSSSTVVTTVRMTSLTATSSIITTQRATTATTRAPIVPNKPTNLTIVSRTVSSISFRWNQTGPNISSCHVTVNSTSTWSNATCNSTLHNCTVSNLPVAGSQHNITLIVTSSDNVNSSSDLQLWRTMPPAPQNISCVPLNTTAVNVTITPPSGNNVISGYVITINTTAKYLNDWSYSNSTSPGTSLSHVFGNLNPGVQYDMAAYSVSSDVKSDIVTRVALCRTVLETPSSPVIASTTETAINVYWTRPKGYYEQFLVRCDGQQGAISQNVTVPANASANDHSNITAACGSLTSGALYNISVRSSLFNSGSPSSWSPIVNAVTVPRAPTSVTVLPVTSLSISVHVTYVTNTTEAQCTTYWIVVNGLTGCPVRWTSEIPCDATLPVSMIVPNLTADCEYNVNATTVSRYPNIDGQKNSSEATGNTSWTIANRVTNMSINEVGGRRPWSLDVRIAAPPERSHVSMYVIRVNDTRSISTTSPQKIELRCNNGAQLSTDSSINCKWSGISTTKNSTTNCTDFATYNITGLLPYVNYTVDVIAVNPGGCSDVISNVLQTDEWHPDCVSPTTIGVTGVQNSSLTLQWAEPATPNGVITNYSVQYVDGCDVTSSRANVTTSDHVTLVGLHPFTEYNVTVTPSTRVGPSLETCGAIVSNRTSVGTPRQPINISVTTINATSLQVSWTLVSNRCYADVTSYNVTADGRDVTFPDDVHTTTMIDACQDGCRGEDKHGIVLSQLDQYWPYNITIRAFTVDSNALYSVDSEVRQGRTNESTPGPVAKVGVVSLATEQQCYLATVSWSPPIKRDLNGIITGYSVEWINMNDTSELPQMSSYSSDINSGNLTVTAGNMAYNVTIRARTSIGGGMPTYSTLSSTGSCQPDRSNDGGAGVFIDNNATIPESFDAKKAFGAWFDVTFFVENRNGIVTNCGIIVAQDNNTLDSLSDYFTDIQSFKKWKDVKDDAVIQEYRATPDDWCGTIQNTRKRRSLTNNNNNTNYYIVGRNSTCSSSINAYCNGNLPSDRTYRVRAIVCTSAGCYVTKYNKPPYKTNPQESLLWIIGLFFAFVLALAIAGLLFYLWRTKRSPFNKRKSPPRTTPSPPTEVSSRRPSLQSSYPILLNQFAREVSAKKRDTNRIFLEEFQTIGKLSPKHPDTAAKLPDNQLKNRFINISPFDRNRVKLTCQNDNPSADYINASFLTDQWGSRDFIACQGPLDGNGKGIPTVNDFWQLIWEQRVSVIVMVTRLIESNKVKCAKYWPEMNEGTAMYGDVEVRLTTQSDNNNFSIVRTFSVTRNKTTRHVTQLHTENWPDFGVPSDVDGFLGYVRQVREVAGPSLDPPIAVHCSAGVGRTGTFIAVERLLRYMRNSDRVDIMRTVLDMREDRCSMVQAETQYIFIHDCIQRAIERGWHQGQEFVYDNDNQPVYMNTDDDLVYANIGYSNGTASTEDIHLETFDKRSS